MRHDFRHAPEPGNGLVDLPAPEALHPQLTLTSTFSTAPEPTTKTVAARYETQMRVLQAARCRALHGVTWHFECLPVRVADLGGMYLAIERLEGVASNLHPDRCQELREALEDAARDWGPASGSDFTTARARA